MPVLLLGNGFEFAAAGHAAGIGFRKVELGADQFQLFEFGERGRHPESFDAGLNNRTPIEQEAIGGDDEGL